MPTLMTYSGELPSDVEHQDDVNSPQHYNANGLETIDLIKQSMSAEEF